MKGKIAGIEIPCFVIFISSLIFLASLIEGSVNEIVILGIPLFLMIIGALISIQIVKKHNLTLKKYIVSYFIIVLISIVLNILFCFFIAWLSLFIIPIAMLVFSMLYFKKCSSKKELLVLFLCNPNVYILIFSIIGLFALMFG